MQPTGTDSALAPAATVAVGPAKETPVAAPASPVEVIDELLIEEISIDGMCGVY